jgi:predicted ATPase
MLTRWTLENFKPIRERLDLPTAPLTVLAGLNSSGKSSFLQSILLIAQTLANQKLDEPLVLNGSLVRFGTFQDVCNDRAKEPQIRIGFTLAGVTSGRASSPSRSSRSTGERNTQPLSISMDVQFEGVAPKEEEGRGLQAVRAVLDSVEMTVVLPEVWWHKGKGGGLSVSVKRATPHEESELISGVAKDFLRNVPYPLGQNYMAEISATDPVFYKVKTAALVQLAHMVPRRYVQRIDPLIRARFDLLTLMVAIGDNPSIDEDQVSPALQRVMRLAGSADDLDDINEATRDSLNQIAIEHSSGPLTGSKIHDLSAWLIALVRAKRHNTDLHGRIATTLISPNRSDDIYQVGESENSPWIPPADQAAQQVINTFSSAIRYLGPLRADPYAIQSYSPSGQPDDVGTRGEYAAAVYASNRKQPIRFWNPDAQQVETATLEDAMDAWLRHLGVADHVSTREAAVPGVSWMVRAGPMTRDRPLQAVGVGVSQVLPILVAGLLAPEGTILIMEQPELHLHERPQARLGDFFYGLTRVGKQVFVETHSAVLINQLRYLMVKRGQEAREAIAIYFVNQDQQGDAHFDPIRISRGGAVENWPDGFFDESFRQEDRITQEGLRARGKRENA